MSFLELEVVSGRSSPISSTTPSMAQSRCLFLAFVRKRVSYLLGYGFVNSLL
jgi:hypothetical protein